MTQLAIADHAPTSKAVVAPGDRPAEPREAADWTRPRFARHAAHVRAVMAQGGFPVMPR